MARPIGVFARESACYSKNRRFRGGVVESASVRGREGVGINEHRHAPEKYEALAAVYDQRWQRYHTETLSRVARLVADIPAPCILDTPCGTGELARWLLQRLPDARIVGVDGAAAMLRVARQKWRGESRVTFQQAMVADLPFTDGTFDWVLCCNSFHYFHQPERILAEFVRVLKPTGHVLILDWCRNPWHCRVINRWKTWFDASHVWMYTAEELHNLLEHSGLAVQRLERFRVSGLAGLKLWEMMICVAGRELDRSTAEEAIGIRTGDRGKETI